MAAEGGAQLEVVDLPVDCADLTQNYSIHIHEFKEDLDGYLRGLDGTAKVHSFDELLQSGLYHPDIEENLLLANKLASDPADYHARLEKIDRLRAALLERMDALRLDALVFPHQQQLCSKVGAGQKDRNGVLSSILGWPSITLPAGYTAPDEDAPLGVPVGLELVGRPWQDLRAVPSRIRLGADEPGPSAAGRHPGVVTDLFRGILGKMPDDVGKAMKKHTIRTNIAQKNRQNF